MKKTTESKERRGFTLNEFVTSCSTCMGKEGLLGSKSEKPKKINKLK